jgi:hypothetical protein
VTTAVGRRRKRDMGEPGRAERQTRRVIR